MSAHTASDVDVTPYFDPTPLPSSIPVVQEVGTTSAPLKSAAFFIGAYCKPFNDCYICCMCNWTVCSTPMQSWECTSTLAGVLAHEEDFMLCKSENRRPEHCLKEGRKVTRCTTEIIDKIRENCLEEFEQHWKCLENNNQTFYMCRKPERILNKCVFTKLGLKKEIPGAPKDQPQIHEKLHPIFGAIQK
ncbi:hypothetical protein FRB96_007650 [Tulasnella sp. 330]|nr:hypothetical protein FRB96_007650 [Tulasnella sp. 330]